MNAVLKVVNRGKTATGRLPEGIYFRSPLGAYAQNPHRRRRALTSIIWRIIGAPHVISRDAFLLGAQVAIRHRIGEKVYVADPHWSNLRLETPMISSTMKWLAVTTTSTLAIGTTSVFITQHETDFNCSNPAVLETLRRSKIDAYGLFQDRIAPETLKETIDNVQFGLIRTMDKGPHGYTCTAVIHIPAWKSKKTPVDKGTVIPETDSIRDYTIKFTDDGRFVLYMGEKLKKHH